ncbi:MAG TPA: MBL fold metallo-hydrolase, partial [Myxococcota bacterium]
MRHAFRHLLVAAILVVVAGACATIEPAPVRTEKIEPAIHVALPAVDGVAPPVLTIRRVAHASVLLEVNGVRILTDPWFTEMSGYRHGEPLGIALPDIGDLTAVVASHGHYDHYDMAGFAPYPHKDVPLIVMKGTGPVAHDVGFTNIHEVAPWQSVDVAGVKITA